MGSCAPIGVFDSGLGGISVLKAMQSLMPKENFIYFGDSRRAPYGTKSVEVVRQYSEEIVSDFVARGAKAVVIACNTATSAAADYLRAQYDIPIIGVEPALKPAAIENPNGHVVVLATEMTLRERKFNQLMQQFQDSVELTRMAVPEFVTLVDQGILQGPEVNRVLDRYLADIDLKTVNGVVLGCTHYVFLKEAISAYFGHRVALYDGNLGTARHLQSVLAQRDSLCTGTVGTVVIENSLGEEMVGRSYQLLRL